MAGLDLSGLGSLPAVDSALLPPEVRDGTPDDRKLYAVALGFERMLVEKLTESLASTSVTGDDEDAEGDGGGSLGALRDQLPGTFADGIAASGGLGLAEELYRTLRQATPGGEPA